MHTSANASQRRSTSMIDSRPSPDVRRCEYTLGAMRRWRPSSVGMPSSASVWPSGAVSHTIRR